MPMARQISEDLLEVREAHHRMMNILATLLAVLRRKFSRFSDQSVRSAVTQLETQILAASELLLTISAKPPADDAAVDVYLEGLSRALSRAILSPANISCEVFSDQGRLPIDVCERLGFILIELELCFSDVELTIQGILARAAGFGLVGGELVDALFVGV